MLYGNSQDAFVRPSLMTNAPPWLIKSQPITMVALNCAGGSRSGAGRVERYGDRTIIVK